MPLRKLIINKIFMEHFKFCFKIPEKCFLNSKYFQGFQQNIHQCLTPANVARNQDHKIGELQ